MKHFTKEEQKKYTESIRKVFTLPEEYLRRADEKLPSDSKELKKDYLKLRSENTLLGERCNQLLTDKGKLTDRVQELEAQIEKMKCCGNCIHCKYDENEESYEWCEVHDHVVNIAIKPCIAYKMFDLDKALKEIKEK